MKAGVIFWSGTGNTEAMAEAVAEGIRAAGAEADVLPVAAITAEEAAAYDVLALGFPAMGDEELEDSEFEPFFAELEGKLSGKKVALFGSHEWSEEGRWMDEWTERTINDGAVVCTGAGLKIYSAPDENGLEKCRNLGKILVSE